MVLSACAVYIYTEYEGVVSADTRTNSGTALSVVGAPQRGRGPCTSSCTVCVVLCVAGDALGNRNTGGVEYSDVRRERRQQRYLRRRGRPLCYRSGARDFIVIFIVVLQPQKAVAVDYSLTYVYVSSATSPHRRPRVLLTPDVPLHLSSHIPPRLPFYFSVSCTPTNP